MTVSTRVHQRGARDVHPQAAIRWTAVDAVIGVRWVVDELSPLFEPCVDRIPWHHNVTGSLGLGFIRQIGDHVCGECVGQRPVPAVHHQRPLGVDDHAPVSNRLDSPRVGFHIDQIVGQRRGKPSAWIGAEWAARSDEAHRWPPMSLVDSILTSDVCQSLAECEASARSAAIIRYAFTLGGSSVPPEWICPTCPPFVQCSQTQIYRLKQKCHAVCESFIRFDRAHGSLANTSAATASPGDGWNLSSTG